MASSPVQNTSTVASPGAAQPTSQPGQSSPQQPVQDSVVSADTQAPVAKGWGESITSNLVWIKDSVIAFFSRLVSFFTCGYFCEKETTMDKLTVLLDQIKASDATLKSRVENLLVMIATVSREEDPSEVEIANIEELMDLDSRVKQAFQQIHAKHPQEYQKIKTSIWTCAGRESDDLPEEEDGSYGGSYSVELINSEPHGAIIKEAVYKYLETLNS